MNRTGPLVVLMLGCLAVLTAVAGKLTAGDSKALTYIWEVDLDKYPAESDGRLISPEFTSWNGIVEEPWQLWFFPHGSIGIRSNCLAVYLYHVKAHPVQIDFTILLVNQRDGTEYANHQTGYLKDNTNGYGNGPCFNGDSANNPPNGIYHPWKGFVVNGKLKIGVRIPTSWIPIKPKKGLSEEQLHRLESEKKSLMLQVSKLTKKVDTQLKQIQDLEKVVNEVCV